MSYIDGFVVPVPAVNKSAYKRQAEQVLVLFREYGATRVVECWGDDVPDGTVTDFKGAVNLAPGEVVVFSWIEWPSKAVRDAGQKRMMEDPRMKDIEDMAFDGQRMIYGGFDTVIDDATGAATGYVDGCLIAVPKANRAAYVQRAEKTAAALREHGAARVFDAWGDDVPDGKVTDFRRAVKATADEDVLYTWIEWPSKAARDSGWSGAMADPRMQPDTENLFDGKRMIYGGFTPILDG